MSFHYHSCPECYEKWPCDLGCTIEPDLDDPICHPDKIFGAHCVCPLCDNEEVKEELFTPSWWDRYHGFIR